MAVGRLTTYKDLVRHVIDYLGANVTEEARRDARRAVLNGYRDLATAHRWCYYYQRGRLNTVAPYTTGLVTYAQSNYQVSLSGGAFPAWAPFGTIQINNVTYSVAGNPDAQTLVLAQGSNPGTDISRPSQFTLYRDTYPLPADALSIDRLIIQNNAFSLWYEHPDVWLERQRIYRGPATPRTYTIRGDPHYFGTMAVSFFPPPDNAYPFDFIYQRSPRPLTYEGYEGGTVSALAGQTAVRGSGTLWSSTMVGSCLRLSADGATLPDGPVGSNPAVLERVVTSVQSPTALTIDSPADLTLSNVKHVVSDPADVEPVSMLTALLRACERQICLTRSRKQLPDADRAYLAALISAREADSRNFALESAGMRHQYPYRLAQMPSGPDVS